MSKVINAVFSCTFDKVSILQTGLEEKKKKEENKNKNKNKNQKIRIYKDKFQLTFVCGKNLVRSDLVVPDENNVISFKEEFKFPCELRLRKNPKEGENKAHTKNLKIVLHRYKNPVTSTNFGELLINISDFFEQIDQEKSLIMNTHHKKVEPKIDFKCSLVKANVRKITKFSTQPTLKVLEKAQTENLTGRRTLLIQDAEEYYLSDDPLFEERYVEPSEAFDFDTYEEFTKSQLMLDQKTTQDQQNENPENKISQEQQPEKEVVQEQQPEKEEIQEQQPEKEEIQEQQPEKEEIQEQQPEKEEIQEQQPEKEEIREQQPEDAEILQEEKDIKEITQENQEDDEDEEEEDDDDTAKQVDVVQAALNFGENMGRAKIMTWKKRQLFQNITPYFNTLLTKPISKHKSYAYLDPDSKEFPFPTIVYHIYKAMIRTRFFNSAVYPEHLFVQAIDIFFSLFPTAPLCPEDDQENENTSNTETVFFDESKEMFNDDFEPVLEDSDLDNPDNQSKTEVSHEQRFQILLLLDLLIHTSTSIAGYHIQPDRYNMFIKNTIPIINKEVHLYLDKYMDQFEQYINEVGYGRNDHYELAKQFSQTYEKVFNSFNFFPSINQFIKGCLDNRLDVNFANKILSNPARFTFSRGASINSFISAVANSNKIEFQITREVISCLLMALNFAEDTNKVHHKKTQVCPNLSNDVFIYILKNYKADSIQQASVNYRLIAKKLVEQQEKKVDIDPDNYSFQPLKIPLFENYLLCAHGISLLSWQACEPSNIR